MRIVIDLQGAQSSGSRNRGIGRYTISLSQAIIRNRGEHEIFLMLNGLFSDTIEPIRADFEGLLPQTSIHVWHAPGPVNSLSTENNWRRTTAELVREAFVAGLKPDMVLVSSLFEGLTDDAVTSIGNLTLGTPTSVILYDLIPLINRHIYLENPTTEAWYETKLDHLRRADLLLAISESSRQEGIRYLSFPAEQTINILTAADPQFLPQQISKEKENKIRQRYNLPRHFVMYTGGIDHRKNIEGLIRAYAKLEKPLRTNHQLAIVCSIQPTNRAALEALAKEQGLASDELILTGFVPEDDLIALYNLCRTFVFPSWHEGFGLPALEAMCCGRAVIGANTSSLPEVIGRDDALFNPKSDESITNKLAQVLSDDTFRQELEQHGLKQAKRFSWDVSAKLAIAAIEKWHARRTATIRLPNFVTGYRRKLAYISPLPPERSGISDYSAELIPELARHYNVEVITSQDTISNPWIKANCPIRTVEWFKTHANRYERVLYHLGNSHFHQHMFELIAKIPGVVVLHDFFLGHIVTHIDGLASPYHSDFLAKTLYQSHGYQAIYERYHTNNVWDLAWKYPCNKSILENSIGVIVHSDNSRRLSEYWLGKTFADDWSVIPLLRTPSIPFDKAKTRSILGLNENAFIICSFGMLGPSKQNHRLLDAWLASPLGKDERCHLVFVGENHAGDYGEKLLSTIRNSGASDRIRLTGWTDSAQFCQYLAAADVGVQLRTLSRGETSAAVLDCMNYGLPTIVNANGAMADLPKDAVWMLPDEFEDSELGNALDTLWKNAQKRHALSERAREVILVHHTPRICADQYALAIERYYEKALSNQDGLVKAISAIEDKCNDETQWLALAQNIAHNQKPASLKQLLLDISILVQRDAKSGIQRVVRSILSELLINPPQGYRIEPVYATPDQLGYRYARQFTLNFLDCPPHMLVDDPVEIANGDIFIGLDLVPYACQQDNFYEYLRQIGVKVYFVVYDLLAIIAPDVFPRDVPTLISKWLETVAKNDGALCISHAVVNELTEWLSVFGPGRLRPFKLGWFHLGADVAMSVPTKGLPSDAEHVVKALSGRPTFLMVGTVEPRKGYAQVLAAFDLLWNQGVDINLVIVGKRGWNVDLLVDTLCKHVECNMRLFWLEGISDEYLEKVYDASTCLIYASEGEGFGLPLIEAAHHKLPIISRDIPVLREVAGQHAFYFSGISSKTLADSILEWMSLDKAGQSPQSGSMPRLTWAQSTQQLLDVVLHDRWTDQWMPDGGYYYFGSDERLRSQVGKTNGIARQTSGVEGYLSYGPFLQLSAGRYQVRVHGEVRSSGTPAAFLDVATRSGTEILYRQELMVSYESGLICEITVSLTKSADDFEVRVWVAADSDLSIRKLEILPESLFNTLETADGGVAGMSGR